jgi:hypothetical protein
MISVILIYLKYWGELFQIVSNCFNCFAFRLSLFRHLFRLSSFVVSTFISPFVFRCFGIYFAFRLSLFRHLFRLSYFVVSAFISPFVFRCFGIYFAFHLSLFQHLFRLSFFVVSAFISPFEVSHFEIYIFSFSQSQAYHE